MLSHALFGRARFYLQPTHYCTFVYGGRRLIYLQSARQIEVRFKGRVELIPNV